MRAGASTVRSPRPCRRSPRAAEGPHPQRRRRSRRHSRPRSGDEGPGRRSAAGCSPEPAPAHNEAQDIPLTIIFEDEHLLVVDKPAGWWSIRPPGISTARWSMPCSTIAAGACPASAAWRGRASSIASTRIPPACWSSPRPMSPMRGLPAVRRPFDRPAISRDRQRRSQAFEGTVDAPLARSAANRKKIAIVEGGRGKRAVTHWKRLIAEGRRPGRMPARNRPHPPGSCPHGVDRSSIARRPGLWSRRKDARQPIEGITVSPTGAACSRTWVHPSGTKHRLSFASPMPPDMQELFNALGV